MPEGLIYFLQSGDGGPVKIGWTTYHPAKRREALQVGNSQVLTYIGWRVGIQGDERALHRHFAAQRMLGEWFEPSEELLAIARGDAPFPHRQVDEPTQETREHIAARWLRGVPTREIAEEMAWPERMVLLQLQFLADTGYFEGKAPPNHARKITRSQRFKARHGPGTVKL